MYEDVVALRLLLPLEPTLRPPDSLCAPELLCLQTSHADRRNLRNVLVNLLLLGCIPVVPCCFHSPRPFAGQHAYDLPRRATYGRLSLVALSLASFEQRNSRLEAVTIW